MAKIVYGLEHLNYGDDEEETGWYLMRYTVTVGRRGGEQTIDRIPVAKFTSTQEVMNLDDAIKDKTFVMLPREWTFKDIPR